jgi:Flp pilus assembly protein TadD
MKRAIAVFILLLGVAGTAHGSEYPINQPITYDDFIKMIVELSTEHGIPELTMFAGSYRVRLTLKDYPRPLKNDVKGPGRGFFRHYSVYEFKAKMFTKTPETCSITFFWKDSLVPYLKKEVKPGQTIDIYAVRLTFNAFDRQGWAMVNEFRTDLPPMDIRDYTKAIEANPKDAKAYFIRGKAHSERGQCDQAIADFTKAIEINPGDAQTYINRGYTYIDKKQYDRAISDYTKALEINPRDAKTCINRGLAYGLKGQHDQAIADFTRAIEIDPKLGLAYYNRATAYRDKGQYDQAIADYTKSLEFRPNEPMVYTGRGKAYLGKKDYAKAWEDVRKVQSLGFEVEPDFLQELQKSSGKQK